MSFQLGKLELTLIVLVRHNYAEHLRVVLKCSVLE